MCGSYRVFLCLSHPEWLLYHSLHLPGHHMTNCSVEDKDKMNDLGVRKWVL